MSRRGMKISNEYAQVLQPRYGSTPKAVIAAVAVSLLLKEHDGKWSMVQDAFVKEWATLYANGIVKQKPLITSKIQEPDVPSSVTDPKDDGSCDPLRAQRTDSADCGEN